MDTIQNNGVREEKKPRWKGKETKYRVAWWVLKLKDKMENSKV